MLTADLLRVRDNGKTVEPRYLDLEAKGAAAHRARAEALVALFAQHLGQRRGDLDEAIKDLVGDGTDYLLTRGLAKLLVDRSTFDTEAVLPPPEVRQRLFAAAAQQHPISVEERGQILSSVAAELSTSDAQVSVSDLEEALYADHDDNQRLLEFSAISGDELLVRYNLALAQAALYRAERLRIRLIEPTGPRCRQLVRYLKFYRLMYTLERRDKDVFEVVLDGPLSLFSSTQKYGLQMALFLPALLLQDQFELEADLRWGRDRQPRKFLLSSNDGLRSHYPDKGTYVTDEQKHFEKSFRKLDSRWKLSRRSRLVNLGGRGILSPDLTFRHRDDGRVAMLDIVGYWRRGWLSSWLSLLEQHGPSNLIVAVSDRLATDENTQVLQEAGVAVLPFKGVIVSRKVLELVEDIAQ